MKKKIAYHCLSVIAASSLVACNNGAIAEKDTMTSTQILNKAVTNINANVSSVQIPEMTPEDLSSIFIKNGALSLAEFNTEDFNIDNFPVTITSTYTAGQGHNEWYGQYISGVLTVNQKKTLCGLYFNSVYNSQFDVIFSDGDCDNAKDGNKCSIPYYAIAHGDMKLDSYTAFINYHYHVALDGKNCANGMSEAKDGTKTLTFKKQYDSDVHPVFKVDIGVHPLLAPDAKINANISKDSQGNKFFSVGYDYSHVSKDVESNLVVDYKMTHDIAGFYKSVELPAGYYACTKDTAFYDQKNVASNNLDSACTTKFGSNWRGFRVNFSNPFRDASVSVAGGDVMFGNLAFLGGDNPDKANISILPGQSKSIDLCVNNNILGQLIKHNTAGKINFGVNAVNKDFTSNSKLASFEVTYKINGKNYVGSADLTRQGKITENGKSVLAQDEVAGYCVANMLEQRVSRKLENLRTDYSLELSMKVKMLNDIPKELYEQHAALNFSHPISIANVGVNKVLESAMYATNVSYYLVDSNNPRKKVDFESWGLYNAVVSNQAGESSILQFGSLELANKWDGSGVSSGLNFFSTKNSWTANKGGFLVVKYDGPDGENHYSQTFPFVVSYNRVYVPNMEYNVFSALPILRNKNGNVVKSLDSIPLATTVDNNGSAGTTLTYVGLSGDTLFANGTISSRVINKDINTPEQNFDKYYATIGYLGDDWKSFMDVATPRMPSDTVYLRTTTIGYGKWDSYLYKLYADAIDNNMPRAERLMGKARILEIPLVNHETGLVQQANTSMVNSFAARNVRLETYFSPEVKSLLDSSNSVTAYLERKGGFRGSESFGVFYFGGDDYKSSSDSRFMREINVGIYYVNKGSYKTISLGDIMCKPFYNECSWKSQPSGAATIYLQGRPILATYQLKKTSGYTEPTIEVNYDLAK